MTRVVADTNVLISAVVFGGVPSLFLEFAAIGSFQLVTSPILLDELDEKLCSKFEFLPEESSLVTARLKALSILVHPLQSLKVVLEDPDDDRVLECAVAGSADCIVGGDRHLLKLKSYASIPVLTIRQFLHLDGRS